MNSFRFWIKWQIYRQGKGERERNIEKENERDRGEVRDIGIEREIGVKRDSYNYIQYINTKIKRQRDRDKGKQVNKGKQK